MDSCDNLGVNKFNCVCIQETNGNEKQCKYEVHDAIGFSRGDSILTTISIYTNTLNELMTKQNQMSNSVAARHNNTHTHEHMYTHKKNTPSQNADLVAYKTRYIFGVDNCDEICM